MDMEGQPQHLHFIREEAQAQAQEAQEKEQPSAGADLQVQGGVWKDSLVTNPEVLEYGEKQAEVVDFAVLDQNGRITNTVEKGSEFTIRMKVAFRETVEDPIFA